MLDQLESLYEQSLSKLDEGGQHGRFRNVVP